MRVADVVHCDEMTDSNSSRNRSPRGRRRGGGEHLVVSLPPPSVSASSTTTTTTTTTNSFEALTPRSLLSRWLLSLKKPLSGGGDSRVVGCRVPFPRHRSKKRTEKNTGKEEDEGGVVVGPSLIDQETVEAGGSPAAPPPPPLVPASTESSTVKQSASSGIEPGELSLNLGLGVGLILLLAKSATEFNKIIKQQKQMAVLLKDIKENMWRKEVPSSFTESNSHFVYSESNCVNENTSNSTLSQNDRASTHLIGGHGAFESDRQSSCGRTEKKPGAKMNQLEMELQVELERLQLNMQGGNSYILPRKHRIEFVAENFDPSESYNLNFVEDEFKEEETSRHYGVPPRELERRLHELLEKRQQERIVELECALECAEKKLHEKEVEICWWRDTARIVSKHKEETLFR